jgi:hypothetical protein
MTLNTFFLPTARQKFLKLTEFIISGDYLSPSLLIGGKNWREVASSDTVLSLKGYIIEEYDMELFKFIWLLWLENWDRSYLIQSKTQKHQSQAIR